MENHLKTELVVDALQMAVWRRKPAPGLVHHSDQGAQYTALSFGERLKEVGIKPSMGRTGSALDNAMAESFVSTLKAELVSNLEFPSRQVAKTAIFEYLETFYNSRRLHLSLGYRSPTEYEEDRMEEARKIQLRRSGARGANARKVLLQLEKEVKESEAKSVPNPAMLLTNG